MKTKPRRFPGKALQSARWSFILIASLSLLTNAHADGIFVAPRFVWDKHRDINEPTQKAIIAYKAGYEALILQVRYDGPVEEFGWLIPVPNVPTISECSMECFYELSKFTQKYLEPVRASKMRSTSEGIGQGIEPEPPVKVIEIKAIGAYQVAVLSAKDAGALENWLAANSFSLPPDKDRVIDSYVKQGWYFVAVKINLSKTAGFQLISGVPKTGANTKAVLKEKLSSGELHPLHLGFASDSCVFPLKISSLNGTPSEVQVYVLSEEPLVEKGMFALKLAENYRWRTNRLARYRKSIANLQALRSGSITKVPPMPEPDHQLSERSTIDDEALVPYAQVGPNQLPECSSQMMLPPDHGKCWLTKQTWTFKAVEMRDLEFVPAIPVFTTYLGDSEGAFVAANLARLGTNGVSALLAAMDSTNPVVRAHAASATERMSVGAELKKRLPKLLKDSDPEVRLHALNAAENDGGTEFFDSALELLRDDNPEVSAEAVSFLTQRRDAAAKHIPLFHEMLKDTNSTVQMAGIRGLLNSGHTIPREELLPLFSVPRMEVAGPAVALLEQEGISCEEAKPLLQNSLWMVRLMGLKILAGGIMTRGTTPSVGLISKESVEFAIPLLRDREQVVRVRTRDILADLTGQDFPVDQPERWEKWWAENKATFVVNKQQVEQRRSERMRQRTEQERARHALAPSDG